jgi:hypothetical protein
MFQKGWFMQYCQKCGEKLADDARFCTKCGAPVIRSEQPVNRRVVREEIRQKVRHEPDILGAVSAGGFLIILALAWLSYPNILSLIIDYFQGFQTPTGFVWPSYGLGQPIMFILNLSGVWGLIIAGLRLVLMHSPGRAVNDVAGALFSFYLAYVLSQYYQGIVTANNLVPLFLVGLGILIIVNVIGGAVTHSLSRRPVQSQP